MKLFLSTVSTRRYISFRCESLADYDQVPDDKLFDYGYKADIAITTRGSDWYWTVTAVMVVSTFAIIGLSWTKVRFCLHRKVMSSPGLLMLTFVPY